MVGRQSGWLDCIEAGKDYKQKAKLSGPSISSVVVVPFVLF
jgi:hypothetical protein